MRPVSIEFPVGSLVRFREREWIVQPSDEPEVLWLRPLHGVASDTLCKSKVAWEQTG